MVVRQSAAEISAEEGEDVSLFRQKPLALFFLLQNTRRYWLVKKGQKKKKKLLVAGVTSWSGYKNTKSVGPAPATNCEMAAQTFNKSFPVD